MNRDPSLASCEWLALQRFLRQIHDQTDLALITQRHARLLEWIFIKRSLGVDLPLQGARGFLKTTSGATIYQSLLELERKGFIDISVDPLDSRRKQIDITEKTSSLMQILSKSVEHWASQIRSSQAKLPTDGSNGSSQSQPVRPAMPVCTASPVHRDGISTEDTQVPPGQDQPG